MRCTPDQRLKSTTPQQILGARDLPHLANVRVTLLMVCLRSLTRAETADPIPCLRMVSFAVTRTIELRKSCHSATALLWGPVEGSMAFDLESARLLQGLLSSRLTCGAAFTVVKLMETELTEGPTRDLDTDLLSSAVGFCVHRGSAIR